jgi:ABC-type nitrate/sulfonate/bicarbonate transport system ATPase subunit
MEKETILRIENLNKSFLVDNERVDILKNINLEVKKGEFITIVGHSGCGKSTLLKIIAGLVNYDGGRIWRDGKDDIKPDKDCGVVFQEHRLLPWLKIKDNVSFGLKGVPAKEKNEIVKNYLKLVRLEGFENVYPGQLSGGMAQRAAIARGLVTNPDILLLDEPFGALDALTRTKMQQEILRIWKEKQTTMIMVTHDLDEALYLGQRIVVMSARPGEIVDIICVESENVKNRKSEDFAFYKKKIYGYFFQDDIQESEYMI